MIMTVMDNTTHHMVSRGGVMTCAYCGKTASELGPEPEQQPCPVADDDVDEPPWNDHVTASPGAIYGVVTAQKRHRCNGHLNRERHYIEKGDRYVASALPPNDPDINNDRWWHGRFCRNCCPIEYLNQVNKESK